MSAAEKIAVSTSWAEIRARYPDQWVCLADAVYDPHGAILTARVVGHHYAMTQAMAQIDDPEITYSHTGSRILRQPRVVMSGAC